MNEQQYKAALGELKRLEKAAREKPKDAQTLHEYLETLRREVKAYEQGARSKGRPRS